jgi:O-antigen/teichoic acid export membrane protein
MKAIAYQSFRRPSSVRVYEWIRLISITGSSQLLVQAIGLISGILVIRSLPTEEYGLYTLANTMLGTMIVLADCGISNSVLAQGGKVWHDRDKLGAVLATGFDLRKKFAVAALLVAIPILLYLLRHHNAGWLTSLLVIGSIIPAFFTVLSGNLLSVGPSLHQALPPLVKVQIGMSLGRLALLLLTVFIFPWACIAIIAAGLPQVWGNRRLRKISATYADWEQKPDPEIKRNILVVVRRILPGSIYYCLSGQITIWIISVFGTTAAVAQIGALGRLSMMLGFFSSLFGALIVPRFARLTNSNGLILKRFLQIQLGLVAMFTTIILLVSIFPTQLLWILGKSYSTLGKELILSVTGSCISLMAGLLFTLSTSRNWNINPLLSIPITLAAIACGAFLINISTLTGVLKFNLFVSSIEVLIYFFYCLFRIRKDN